MDTARIAGQEVLGICGFWDGMFDNGKCGCGIVLMAFSVLHGWFSFYKKCGPVPGNSSMDAEMGGCGMLIDNLQPWMVKVRTLKACNYSTNGPSKHREFWKLWGVH